MILDPWQWCFIRCEGLSLFDSLFILFGFYHFIKTIFHTNIWLSISLLLSTHLVYNATANGLNQSYFLSVNYFLKELTVCQLANCGHPYAFSDLRYSGLITKSKYNVDFCSVLLLLPLVIYFTLSEDNVTQRKKAHLHRYHFQSNS